MSTGPSPRPEARSRARLHELRNALRAAEAAADGLRVGAPGPEGTRLLLEALTESVTAARALAAEPGAPVVPRRLADVPLDDLLARRVAVARTRGLAVEVRGATGVVVHACRSRLVQVLENLLDNLHGVAGADGVVIHVGADDPVVVRVFDRGPGLPPTVAAGLSRRAARLDEPAGVAGLGLPLALRMVRAMGGELWASGRRGGGTCVALALPRSGSPRPVPALAATPVGRVTVET